MSLLSPDLMCDCGHRRSGHGVSRPDVPALQAVGCLVTMASGSKCLCPRFRVTIEDHREPRRDWRPT